MMTLREFVEKVNFFEHFRVYQSNRDCLIYESFFKIHSPYFFNDLIEINNDYWDNNDYCNSALKTRELDAETKEFLDVFGNYEIFSMECSSFRPSKMYKDENDVLKIEHVVEESRPNSEYLDCFNLFIIPPREN